MSWREYARLEWRGAAFYRRHNVLVTRAIWTHDDLRPVRALLSAVSAALGLYFFAPDIIECVGALVDFFNGPLNGWPYWLPLPWSLYANPGFRYISAWVPNETALASMFVLQGFGLSWRNYAPSHRPIWGYFFAALGVTLYVGYPLAITLDIGRLTGQSMAMFTLGMAHVWCGRRIGVGSDRSGA